MPAAMRCACVDIGANTTRLLVADRDGASLREVLARRVFVPLVPGADGVIAQSAVAAVAGVVARHVSEARACGAQRIDVVATAALREAANRDALCASVESRTTLPVRVLSDAEEARLAFAGATRTLRDPPVGTVGVIDVGGGSCELVTGTVAAGMEWFASLRVGSAVLTRRHVRSDPPSPADLDALRSAASAAFAAVTAPRPHRAYAVGGSATSLRRLCGDELRGPALEAALERILAWPAAEAARRLGLAPERVRLLPAGLLLLAAACAAFGDVRAAVARGGMREGVLLEDRAPGARE
jgi:exopolyphosphatase/guanosine-5'-triphosphate,3'-diphosphate pyrophosphatase